MTSPDVGRAAADVTFMLNTEEGKPLTSCRAARGEESMSDSSQKLLSPLLEQPEAAAVFKISAPALTMNLVNATLGSGILSLPWAMAGASVLVGAGLTFFVLLLNGLTNLILVMAAERHKAFDLGSLMGKLPGTWSRPVRWACDVSIWLSVGLTLVGYFMVVADALEPILSASEIPSWSGKALAVSLGALVVLPLCFLDQNRLAFSSTLSVAANIYLLCVICYLFARRPAAARPHFCILGEGRGAVTMCSALMQAIIFQMCSLPMYETLENRSAKRFAACLTASFSFVFFLFMAMSYMALSLFGPRVSSNILQDLPDDSAGNLARLAMGLSVLGVYPIYLDSMVAPLRHAEARAARHHAVLALPSPQSPPDWAGSVWSPASMPPTPNSPRSGAEEAPPADTWGRTGRWGRVKLWGLRTRLPAQPSHLATLLIVAGSAVGGWSMPHLGVCNIINGASQVAGMVGWAPGLAGIYLLGWRGRSWQLLMFALIIFATCMSTVGIVYTDNFVKRLNCSWKSP